jgi:hypothetical protein
MQALPARRSPLHSKVVTPPEYGSFPCTCFCEKAALRRDVCLGHIASVGDVRRYFRSRR